MSAKLRVASNAKGDLPCLLTLLLAGIRTTLVGAFMLTISLRPEKVYGTFSGNHAEVDIVGAHQLVYDIEIPLGKLLH
jgi:hypothetical protein